MMSKQSYAQFICTLNRQTIFQLESSIFHVGQFSGQLEWPAASCDLNWNQFANEVFYWWAYCHITLKKDEEKTILKGSKSKIFSQLFAWKLL